MTLASTVLLLLASNVELRMEHVMLPPDADEVGHLADSRATFGVEATPAAVIATLRRPDTTGPGVLTEEALRELAAFESDVTALTATRGTDSAGKDVALDDVCFRAVDSDPAAVPCQVLSVMSFWGGSVDAMAASAGNGTLLDDLASPVAMPSMTPRRMVLGGLRLQTAGVGESGALAESDPTSAAAAAGGDAIAGADAAMTTFMLTGVPRTAGAFHLFSFLTEGDADESSTEAWESAFFELAEQHNTRADAVLHLDYAAKRSEQDGFLATATGSTDLVFGCIVLMVLYVSAVFATKELSCRSVLTGLAGVACVVAAVLIGLAITVAFGQVITVSTQFAFFLALGIGLDGIFVVMDVFFSCPRRPDWPLQRRIEHTLRHAGPSVTIASFTDILAFGAAATGSFPLIRIFCVGTAVVLTVNYVLLWTFFIAVVRTLDHESPTGRTRGAVAPVPVESRAVASAPSGSGGGGGGDDNNGEEVAPPTRGNGSTNTQGDAGDALTMPPRSEASDDDVDDRKPSRRLQHAMACLLNNASRVAVILAAVGFATYSGYVVGTDVRQGYGPRNILRDDSYFLAFLNAREEHFTDTFIPVELTVRELQPLAAAAAWRSLVEAVTGTGYVDDATPLVTWYDDWLATCVGGSGVPMLPPVSAEALASFLSTWCGANLTAMTAAAATEADAERIAVASVRRFLQVVPWYAKDVVLSTTPTAGTLGGDATAGDSDDSGGVSGRAIDDEQLPYVVAARGAFGLRPLPDVAAQIQALQDLTDVTDTSPLDAFVLGQDFIVFRMYTILAAEVVSNLVLAVVIALLVLMLFLHPSAVVMVVALVAFVCIDLAAGIALFNTTLNPITLGALTISVGLSLDYSAHVAHSFVGAEGTHRERAAHALNRVGMAVLNGGLTTALGLFVLFFAPADAFESFASLFLYMVALGLAHGLVVLPVLLSLAGPAPLQTAGGVAPHDARAGGNSDDGGRGVGLASSAGGGADRGSKRSADRFTTLPRDHEAAPRDRDVELVSTSSSAGAGTDVLPDSATSATTGSARTAPLAPPHAGVGGLAAGGGLGGDSRGGHGHTSARVRLPPLRATPGSARVGNNGLG